MKRLLLVLTLFAGIAAFTAATAAGADPSYTLTLTATPAAMHYGDTTVLAGTLGAAPDTTPVAGYDVWISLYDDPQCLGEPYDVGVLTTDANGDYGPGPLPIAALGTFYFDASAWDGDALLAYSDCVAVTVTLADEKPPVPTPVAIPSNEAASSYLCWNRQMVDPVAYIDEVADEMWATGKYYEPQAVLGNVAGGTNIGAYHLVCNAPSTMKATDQALGGSGEVFNALDTGLYHAEHTLNANDLNVYHIWK